MPTANPEKDNSADLMKCLVSKLYSTVTGSDDNIKIPRNKFVTWMMPGIPFTKNDFKFCTKGLIGKTAEETKELYHQAFVLAKIMDFVPDVDNEFFDAGLQQAMFATTQDSISSVYGDILKYSRVVNKELSEKEKAKLEKFRNLLSVTKETTNIMTDEVEEVTAPGPLTLAYNTYLNEYIEAADEYMNLLIDAQSAKGDSEESIRRVASFANKSKFIRKRMEAAYMAWVSQGYKNEYEQINAYIDQVTSKSMVLYKQDLIRKYENAVLTSPVDGSSDFYYTTMIPGNFASSDGWTEFGFHETDYETHYDKKTSQWSAGGGLSIGMFSLGGKASGSKTEISTNMDSSKFKAEFEFAQVPICRPWFEPGFFSMRGWTLDDLWNLNYDKEVSNGAEKPVGRLVSYPSTALFVRNVKLTFDQADSQMDYVKKQVSGGGAVGWGPFCVAASYSRGSEKRDFTAHTEGGSIVIEGMQLIGMINNIVPKCPDTNPDLKPEDFVGGEE